MSIAHSRDRPEYRPASRLFGKRFPIEVDGPVPFYLQPVTLDLVADQKELIAAIKRQLDTTAPVLVVLDTLNRSLQGLGERLEGHGGLYQRR